MSLKISPMESAFLFLSLFAENNLYLDPKDWEEALEIFVWIQINTAVGRCLNLGHFHFALWSSTQFESRYLSIAMIRDTPKEGNFVWARP